MPKKKEHLSSPKTQNLTSHNEKLEESVMASVSSVVSFIKTHVSSRLVEASSKKMFTIERSEMEKINNILGSLIDEAYFRSSGEVVNTLRSHDK